jgi:mRNA deadenylase 3'-5' endonuclease subunit Ccr4
VLHWDFRRQNLEKELRALNSDIYGFQEVDMFENFLFPTFGEEYHALYKQRTGTRKDGCAILARKSK